MTQILNRTRIGDEVEDVSVTHDIDSGGDKIYSSHLHLDGDVALDIVNAEVNDIILLCTKQDATGGRVITFSAKFEWAGGIAPVLTTTPNSKDTFMFIYGMNDNIHIISYQLDVKAPA